MERVGTGRRIAHSPVTERVGTSRRKAHSPVTERVGVKDPLMSYYFFLIFIDIIFDVRP